MAALFHLKPKSKKGKNRIHEHGNLWKLINTVSGVLFCGKPGPWYYVNSLKRPDYYRWVHHNDDEDLIIIEKIEYKEKELTDDPWNALEDMGKFS
jgi:hypothetical protein